VLTTKPNKTMGRARHDGANRKHVTLVQNYDGTYFNFKNSYK